MTLAFEDANSILVEVVTVAEKRVDNNFGGELEAEVLASRYFFVLMLSTKFVEDFEVEVSVRLKINFRQYFAADVWLKL